MNTGLTCGPRNLAIVAACALAVGVAAAMPAGADPAYPPSYGSNGVFGVGDQNRDGVTAYIPAGRYRVDQSPSMYPYESAPGFWQRCSALPCASTYPQNIVATGYAQRQTSTFMDILPTDAAVHLYNVTLTVAG